MFADYKKVFFFNFDSKVIDYVEKVSCANKSKKIKI